MVRNYLSIVLISLLLSACALPQKQFDNNQAFTTHQYKSSDIDITWKSEKLSNALLIAGTVTNPSACCAYKSVELEATLVGKQGKVLGKNIFHFLPGKFKGPESFTMTVPIENDELPERIQFDYRYAIDDDLHYGHFESNP